MDRPSREQATRRVIGIVAGSGGPQALVEILAGLPGNFALPILVVQPMPDQNLGSYIAWIARKCPIPVTAAMDRQVPEPGKVYVAGTDHNLLIEQGNLRLIEREDRIYDPKDVLFRSMARDLGAGSIAVVLTGMGRDGAQGMKEVRDAGGYTIAQDEFTSRVYSTPRFAVEINAACESLPLKEIAPRLLTLVADGTAGLK
jgi:two-component system chemotaxis response regulator CheB